MKRYTFRLDQVLRVRRIEEDRARAALLRARAAEVAAAAEVQARLTSYHGRPVAPAVQPARSFLAERTLVAHAAASVHAAADARRAAEAVVDDERTAWAGTHRRVTALERLDERRRDEHAIEVRRDEDAVVDDLVVARFRSRS